MDLCRDLTPSDLVPTVGVPHSGDWCVNSVSVMLKVCHSETHGCHRTPLGVDGFTVTYGITLYTIILHGEEHTEKIFLNEDYVGLYDGIVRLLSNEELYILDLECVVGSVVPSSELFSRSQEEEEGNPGEISYGELIGCHDLGGFVEGLDDAYWEGVDSYRRRFRLSVGSELSSQEKVELYKSVVPRVVGTHI